MTTPREAVSRLLRQVKVGGSVTLHAALNYENEIEAGVHAIPRWHEEEMKNRDMEWWEAIALVDNVAPTPEACKQWVINSTDLFVKQAVEAQTRAQAERIAALEEALRGIAGEGGHCEGSGYWMRNGARYPCSYCQPARALLAPTPGPDIRGIDPDFTGEQTSADYLKRGWTQPSAGEGEG